ncbi:E3 ubiquitin-protein ligase ubr1 [Pichia californica]|nr:E3 ubiquitin-protein ligase ubr1 [[Candida] californica]
MSSLPSFTNVDIDDYKNSNFAKELINQLLTIPTIEYFEHRTEILLFRSLHFALSDHGKYYDHFLPKEFVVYPRNWDQVNDASYSKGFYLDQIKKKTKGHNGHICASSIPFGKMVYNCYDCGVDPTCCMCEDCFNKEEHSDHNVGAHKSSGDAICDCGDSSSWKINLKCKANEKEIQFKKKLKPLPIQFKKNISILIRVLFDFILDVNLKTLAPLPDFKFKNSIKNSNYIKSRENFIKELSNLNTLPNIDIKTSNQMYKYKFIKNPPDYSENVTRIGNFMDYHCLVVWNDEFHNFDEANRFLNVAYKSSNNPENDNYPFWEFDYKIYSDMEINETGVQRLAKIIDEKGFVLYSRSKDRNILEEQVEQFKNFERSGHTKLTYTILTAKEYANIFMCRSILVWFEYLFENENILLSDFVKQELSTVLFEKASFSVKSMPLFNELQPSPYLLNENLQIPIYKESLTNFNSLLQLTPDQLDTKINKSSNPKSSIKYLKNSSRLQYLTFFEMRFPKEMRKNIKKLIIPTISNTHKSRFEFAKQILTILPICELNTAFFDREYHLSILETFRLQVYHDPNLGSEMLKLGLFENILDSILYIMIHSKFLNDNKYSISLLEDWKLKRTRNVFIQSIAGLDVLMKFLHSGLDQIFDDSFMIKIYRIFYAFNEIPKLIRRKGIHEEFQNELICISYYNSLTPMYAIAQNFSRICNGIKSKNEKVESAIILLTSIIYKNMTHLTYYNSNEIDYTTNKDGVSMSHPVGNLLVEIMRSYKFNDNQLTNKYVDKIIINEKNQIVLNIKDSSEKKYLSFAADEMLQPWAFHAQLSCNFWIRNGVYAEFANSMFYVFKPENCLYLIQQGLMNEGFELSNIAKRYMLLEPLINGSDFENTDYQEKLPTILHEFISLFYNLLTFRQYYDSNLSYDQILSLLDEYAIAAMVASSPMRYSELEKFPSNSNDFEKIVDKVTKYVPPVDSTSYGYYTLKDDYWQNIDPFSCLHGKISNSEIEEILIKKLSSIKGKKESDIVITPYIYPLNENDYAKFKRVGEFMRESTFVKIIFKILNYAVTTENDYHLNIILQLIHAIILDDEICNKGKSHGLKYFVEIPICNLLMTAAEKTDLPKYVSKKASTVLELLLLKDDDVLTSLTDCFGAAHIEEYRKSIKSKSNDTSDDKKKKKNAQKRQRKILNRMKKQQNAFLDNNKTFLETSENQVSSNSSVSNITTEKPSTEARSCIICKTPETNKAMFGIPVFISTSSNYWTIPTIDDCPPEFMVPGLPKIEESKAKIEGKSSCCREKLIAYGCPHGMHYSCFKTMLEKKHMTANNFSCPLCKGKYNMFIPSFKLGEIEVDAKSFKPKTFTVTKLHDSFNGNNVDGLSKQIFETSFNNVLSFNNSDYKSLVANITELNKSNESLNKSLPPFKVLLTSYYRNLRKGLYSQFSMPLLIASTLEMQEISSREQGTIAIPEILNLTLKSLLQYRILNSHEKFGNDGNFIKQQYFGYIIDNPYIGFMETAIILFTETNIALETCIKFSFMKRIVYTALSILQRFKVDPNNLKLDSILDKKIGKPNAIAVSAYTQIFQSIGNVLPDMKCSSYLNLIQSLHSILKSNFKNYERQVKYISMFFNTLPLDNGKSLMPNLNETLENLLRKESNNDKEFKDILIGGMPVSANDKLLSKSHKRDEKIDIIEYPQNIHLIKLSENLKEFALSGSNKTEKILYSTEMDDMLRVGLVKCSHVCLNCGTWLNKLSKHVKECKLSGYGTLFFNPMKNQMSLHLSKLITFKTFKIESPYLNKHGEPSKGVIGSGDAGALGVGRYEHLEKVWFDQSIIRKYMRESNIFFNSINGANDSANQAYIPGIFEPISQAKKGPDISQIEHFQRLLNMELVVFETIEDAINMNPRSQNNYNYDDEQEEESELLAMQGNENIIAGIRAFQQLNAGGGGVGAANNTVTMLPVDPPLGFDRETTDNEFDDEFDNEYDNGNDNFEDEDDEDNDGNFPPGGGFFQFMPQFGANGPFHMDNNDNFFRVDDNDDIEENGVPFQDLNIMNQLMNEFRNHNNGDQNFGNNLRDFDADDFENDNEEDDDYDIDSDGELYTEMQGDEQYMSSDMYGEEQYGNENSEQDEDWEDANDDVESDDVLEMW